MTLRNVIQMGKGFRGCKRIANGILWEMSELITQEWIDAGSSNFMEGLIA